MAMQPSFVYLTWNNKNRNTNLDFIDDRFGTVVVSTSVGVYKNNYADLIMERSGVYYWEIKIIKGKLFQVWNSQTLGDS